MHSFNTITQYDNFFDNMFSSYPKSSKGTACFYFAVTVAQDCAKGVILDPMQYDNAINRAIMIACMTNTSTIKTFNEAIKQINLNTYVCRDAGYLAMHDPMLTTIVPDVVSEPRGWYCTIIKKDIAFFAVAGIYANNTSMYYVRDINKKIQYNFTIRENLVEYLKKNYNITTPVIIDGILIVDMSSVEYVKISVPLVDTFEESVNRVMTNQSDTPTNINTRRPSSFLGGIICDLPVNNVNINNNVQRRIERHPNIRNRHMLADVARGNIYDNLNNINHNPVRVQATGTNVSENEDEHAEGYVEQDPRYIIDNNDDGDDDENEDDNDDDENYYDENDENDDDDDENDDE